MKDASIEGLPSRMIDSRSSRSQSQLPSWQFANFVAWLVRWLENKAERASESCFAAGQLLNRLQGPKQSLKESHAGLQLRMALLPRVPGILILAVLTLKQEGHTEQTVLLTYKSES